ncbi:hypothetical protein [Streptomyces sp. NPDC001978]|uniref:hypothetical protein n=1 Tax=Streptomyces sp. NPDC001978 TaxID=3364627 RepID=UPI003685232A
MISRTQRRRRAAWWTTPVAALCPALALLLAALVMCLGYAAHDSGEQAAAPMTAMSVAQQPTGIPAQHQALPVAHSVDCPSHDMCCGSAIHDIRTVLTAPAQPLPSANLPRIPSILRPAPPACSADPPPTGGAPDLHVLQVQRT